VGLAVGEGATVGADPAPPELGRMATIVTATTSTTPTAMNHGTAALPVVDRRTLRVFMDRSSVAAALTATELRPNRCYDIRRSASRRGRRPRRYA
jgi:hypothetical protein